MNRVRNVLLRSSIVGLTTSSSSTNGSTARRTVVLKPRSMSASGEESNLMLAGEFQLESLETNPPGPSRG